LRATYVFENTTANKSRPLTKDFKSFTGRVLLTNLKDDVTTKLTYTNSKRQVDDTDLTKKNKIGDVTTSGYVTSCYLEFECYFTRDCDQSDGSVYIQGAITRGVGSCSYPSVPGGYGCSTWRQQQPTVTQVCTYTYVPDPPTTTDPYVPPTTGGGGGTGTWAGQEYGYPSNWWLDDAWLDQNFSFSLVTDNPLNDLFQLNPQERALVRQYPYEALKIKLNKMATEKETTRRFGTPWTDNVKLNAFKHAFFVGLNALYVGPGLADQFADAHESVIIPGQELSTQMDLFNNDAGIVLARYFTTESGMSNAVNDLLLAGDLRYLNPLTSENKIIPNVTVMKPTNQ